MEGSVRSFAFLVSRFLSVHPIPNHPMRVLSLTRSRCKYSCRQGIYSPFRSFGSLPESAGRVEHASEPQPQHLTPNAQTETARGRDARRVTRVNLVARGTLTRVALLLRLYHPISIAIATYPPCPAPIPVSLARRLAILLRSTLRIPHHFQSYIHTFIPNPPLPIPALALALAPALAFPLA